MSVSDVKIQVDKVYKIFGNRPDDALAELRAGAQKAEVLQSTGCVVGLKDIDFSIHRGETFVIMGLSGSGKSTLIRHFNRLIEPTAGRILVDGRNIMEMNAKELIAFRRTGISMVFQRFGLLPHQTVLENTICGPILQGVNRREAVALGMEQLELVGLKGFENRFPRQLSGGMQQRVGLARALATQADVLLMDEAFSALDPLIKSDMQEQLKDIQARLKKTIIFITHDLDEALHLGDRIAILKDGELRQVGTGEEILFRPADDYVERFVRKVDLSRALYAHEAFTRIPVLTQAEATPERSAALLGEHPGVIVARDGASRLLARGASGEAVPVASIDANAALGQCFAPLAAQNAILVTEGGTAIGMLTREMAFKALARAARPA
ncbi:betaine/proline/choline family ABC transporter ATP-binding protein [Shinella yambaruensis]|uniref:Quaternary amine transport ATP-binding protein n=1 Tax=Shinella yambaruensis TaxID=415996 RepID=A0ABQ5ZFN9_9HYPH|nr:betaine/proline/choline family ABC transporter ATP-binding protein [Shinella yambaruensis]MCJ8029282.1 betaine/proline/choline family ABC transporter ATP-binding protein [Shinella yambaruensis]MCU7983869.1 betaine/proline/choline family ABC transporter ATP-binding protein [Shinella yambaruensis]GLR50569.1 ABC transporter ATP-binding protein [Shinella yambaruensis]